MGRPDPPPPGTQRRNPLRRQLAGTSILLALLVLAFLCYTRSTSLPTILAPMAHAEPLSSLPSLTHPALLATLPSSALPKPGSPARLLVIGDVHGQLSALDALLAKAGFSAARGDRVVFTGDMVNKGPDSGGVVDRAMAIGALGVRGNHEDRVLRAWKKMHGGKRKHGRRAVEGEEGEVEGEDSSSGEEVRGEEDGEEGSDLTPAKLSKSTARDRATAALLTPAQVSWLAKLPVILRVGAVSPYYGDVIVVHAGLVPGIALEEQDPWAAMHMRTLISRSSHSRSAATPDSEPPSLDASRRRTFKPSEGREGRPWAEVWNEAQKQKAKAQKKGKGDEEEQGGGKERRTTVIYGHDAKVGLSIRRYAFGLDSNCVKGGDLTALVFEAASSTFASASGEEDHSDEEEDVSEQAKHGITHRLVSVPCEAPDSDDDKGGKKKKKDKSKHKDKGKGEKKHKDHNK